MHKQTHIHILFYGRVRRLEKARRPFCNRVPDQLTSKKGAAVPLIILWFIS